MLYAPAGYRTMPRAALDEIVGGCGPGKIGDMLVPDTVWGLSIRKACRIHDFMYHFGETIEDKKEADRVFLNNMLRIIRSAGGPRPLVCLRMRRARKYYLAVKYFGGPAFWEDKNPAKTMTEAA